MTGFYAAEVWQRREGIAAPINQDRIQRLKDHGLTEYQARVYLALLDLGSATASEIPEFSRVPRTRIYSTVQELHGKGLVKILPEKPLRYQAEPFSRYLKSLAEDYRGRAQRIDSAMGKLAQEFQIVGTQSADPRGRFEALYGRRSVRKRIGEMYASAKEEIISVGTIFSPGRINRSLGSDLAERIREGVRVKMAFQITPANLEDVRALQRFAEIRSIDFYTPVSRHGVDGRQFLMNHAIPDDDSTSRGEDIAIWTNDPAIAEAMIQMTDLIWEMGTPSVLARPEREERRRALTTAGP